jgi:formate hydrogenlyase transcriptional activator
VFPIESPPLRERSGDIPVLVDYFVARFAQRMGKHIRSISHSALAALQDYTWPGNVRELQNVLERAVILADGDVLRVPWLEQAAGAEASADSSTRGGSARAGQAAAAVFSPTDVGVATADGLERERIVAVLRRTRGRVAGEKGAARLLGVPASTLESRIRKLGIDKATFRYDN